MNADHVHVGQPTIYAMPLSAKDLSALWRIPIGTIYRWAHEDHWRRTSRPVRYHAGDAERGRQKRLTARQS
jgi:hypothetical protein